MYACVQCAVYDDKHEMAEYTTASTSCALRLVITMVNHMRQGSLKKYDVVHVNRKIGLH